MQSRQDTDEGGRPPRLHWWIFAPVGALVVLAGYLGLQMGQPVSDSEIISHFAAIYVAKTGNGAAMSDCYAVPAVQEHIRLIVTCTHPDGSVFVYPSGPLGDLRKIDAPQEQV